MRRMSSLEGIWWTGPERPHSSSDPRTAATQCDTRMCSTLPRAAPCTSGPELLGLVPAEVATWIPQATSLGAVAGRSPERSRWKGECQSPRSRRMTLPRPGGLPRSLPVAPPTTFSGIRSRRGLGHSAFLRVTHMLRAAWLLMVTEGPGLTPAVTRGLAPVGLRFAHLLPFKAARCSLRMGAGDVGWPLGTLGWSRGWGRSCFGKVASREGAGPHLLSFGRSSWPLTLEARGVN